MSEQNGSNLSRREVLVKTGGVAVASALAGVNIPFVHAGEDNTIRVALVGCGGRGTGAAENALKTKSGPIKLVAMADVFPGQIKNSYAHLSTDGDTKDKVDVPEDRKFVSFDGYQKAMDCLRPGDVVILTTPPAFRWPHFAYAINKGINVFMEKPTTVDGPSTRKMLDLADESVKKNLKVGVGLMCRHCVAREELTKRIKDGEMGDIVLLRAYRMAGPTAMAFSKPKPDNMTDLMYQIQRFHSFLWASGGAYSDFLIHNIDESCWMKDAWPVQAKASGGRHYRGDYIDQNFDSYSVEYTFKDGAKFFLEGRTIEGCHNEFASYAHGTKASAIVSKSGHWPSYAGIYKGQNIGVKDQALWTYPQPEKQNPYQVEWDRLIVAIRENKSHNEAKRGAEASLVTAMGRMAAHTGRIVTYDEMLRNEHELAPTVDKLTFDSPAPVMPGSNGKYPVPQPGNKEQIRLKREYI